MDEFFGFSLFFGIIYIVEIVFNVFIFYFVIKVIVEAFKKHKTNNYFKSNVVYYQEINGKSSKYANEYVDVSKDKLAKFNTDDINALKGYFYEIFYNFEIAYNNLDYRMMKLLSTEQLYENYHTGISLDLKYGKKKVISDIQKKKVIIYELDSTMLKQVASVYIEVSYLNYTLDKNGYVILGSRDFPVTEKFEVQFRKDYNRKKLTHCPNCGAALNSNKCEYCKTKIRESDFRISSIKRIIKK